MNSNAPYSVETVVNSPTTKAARRKQGWLWLIPCFIFMILLTALYIVIDRNTERESTSVTAPVQDGLCIRSKGDIAVYIDTPKIYVLIPKCDGTVLKVPFTLPSKGQPVNLKSWRF